MCLLGREYLSSKCQKAENKKRGEGEEEKIKTISSSIQSFFKQGCLSIFISRKFVFQIIDFR